MALRIVGGLMVASVFLGMFAYSIKTSGWKETIKVLVCFIASILIALWVTMGILLMAGRF